MDSQDKMVVAVCAMALITVAFMMFKGFQKEELELQLKYAAAVNGAPVAVCVK